MGFRRNRWAGGGSTATALVAAGALAVGSLAGMSVPAFAAGPSATVPSQPAALASPYEYLGWGSPQPPAQVMAATGVRDLTLAFVLSHGACNPEWDGSRPLTGGGDAAAIASIRAAGGDVDVSFGGWSGKKLGSSCTTVAALASAYQRVIGAYALRAIDVDIEHTEFTRAVTRQRVIAALATVQRADPGLEISITFGTDRGGPDANGRNMIDQAASLGFQPYAWTIMPFDFGSPVADMGSASITAAEGLDADLAASYHVSPATAFHHVGISSMNGATDEPDETVTATDFTAIVAFAQAEHLARLTFWSVNRDRPCTGGSPVSDSCSGIAQQPLAFTSILSRFHG